MDEEIVADVCLFGLLFELLTALGLYKYLHAIDGIYFLS